MGVRGPFPAWASVNEARRGEGGKGDNRGSAAKVPLAASILKVMAGLIERLRSALVDGTDNPTGPTPSPAFWFWCLLTCSGAVPIDCEAETCEDPCGPDLVRGLDALLSTLGLRLNAGSDGDIGTGNVSATPREPGDTDRAGRLSTLSSRERPGSRGVEISEGPGEKTEEGKRGRDSCVGVAVGEVSSN